jgi:glycosyltransferase involved in cell wall biosynthesis
MNNGVGTQRPIIVTGSHRSGTTWAGRMLALTPSVHYVHEPLNHNDKPLRRGLFRFKPPHWYVYICKDNEQQYLDEFRRVFALRFDISSALKHVKMEPTAYGEEELKLIEEYVGFANAHLQRKIPLVKDPFTAVSLPWFEQQFGARPVVLIRHPAAFVSSLLRLGWKHSLEEYLAQPLLMRDFPVEDERDIELYERYKREGNHAATAALGWKYLHSVIARHQDAHPNWRFVRHEDLSRDPEAGFRKLYDHLDLPFTDAVKAAIRNHSGEGNPQELDEKQPHAIHLDSAANVKNWQHRLDTGTIDLIRELTEDVSSRFYTDEDWADESHRVHVTKRDRKKIVILSMSDGGGAGTAAWRLHRGLLSAGNDSTMLVGTKKRQDPTVRVLPLGAGNGSDLTLLDTDASNAVWKHAAERWKRNMAAYPNRPPGLETFTDGRSDIRLDLVREIRDADLVNLHWVAGLMDVPTAGPALAGKPVVWTLHDLNAFTGGCHYSAGCMEYRNACGTCPALGSNNREDLSRTTWTQRDTFYRDLDLHVVTPSAWLANEARTSGLLRGRDVRHIRNAHPLDVFKPRDTHALRQRLRIEDDEKVILFSADAVSNQRKGFALLEQALPHLASRIGGNERVVLLTMGRKPAQLALPPNFRVHHLGSLVDENRVSAVYSLANLFVIPSLEDNLPNTIAESMACGTPAVGFAIGGIPEMIEHQNTGYLAKPFDVTDLALGMAWVLDALRQDPDIRQRCRQNAERNYEQKLQTAEYLTLFEELMAEVVMVR